MDKCFVKHLFIRRIQNTIKVTKTVKGNIETFDIVFKLPEQLDYTGSNCLDKQMLVSLEKTNSIEDILKNLPQMEIE